MFASIAVPPERPFQFYISETVQERGKLLLITNRKSYMSFRLVPKSVTLNDLERSLYGVVNPSVCRLSVTFVRAPYSAG